MTQQTRTWAESNKMAKFCAYGWKGLVIRLSPPLFTSKRKECRQEMLEEQQDHLSIWLCLLWLATKEYFAQCPDLLFSPMIDFVEQAKGPLGACMWWNHEQQLHWAEALAAGTPPVTYVHLDIEPLTAVFSLWLLLSSQFLVYGRINTENPYLSSLLARRLCITVSEVCRSLGRCCCSCLFQPHKSPCCRWQPD